MQSEEAAQEAKLKAENQIKSMKDTMDMSINLLNDNREELK